MGDPTSDLVFSIDIGVVNVGVLLYDKKKNKILFGDKLSLASSLRSVRSEYEYVPRVYKLFFDQFTSKCRKMMDKSCVVLIEKQMKTRMINIQHIISGFCVRFNIKHRLVSPRTIKAFFKIGSKSRKDDGTYVKGVKENHSANKKLAIIKASELFPSYMNSLSSSKKDDVADALLQAIWFSKSGDVSTSTSGESPFYLALTFDPNTYVQPTPPPLKRKKRPTTKPSKKRKLK